MSNQSKILLRANIISLYKLGWTGTKIATYLNINKNTVSLWISRYNINGTINEESKSGRKRKTTKEQDSQIIKIVKNKEKNKNNFTIDEIKIELNNINIYICNNTIINRMREYNFYSGYPFKKPLLTQKQKEERLQWALDNYFRNWFEVIFSDESTIIKDNNINKKIWIGPETINIKRITKHSIKRQLYGCIYIGGLITFDIFKENMNSEKYIDILKKNFVDVYNKNRYLIYQHDNSPIHTSKKTLNFIKENNITTMRWPANSPDLNPIENMWFLLKYKLLNYEINAQNFDTLITEKLNEIKYEHIFNMIASMPIRICKVIQNNGDSIDY